MATAGVTHLIVGAVLTGRPTADEGKNIKRFTPSVEEVRKHGSRLNRMGEQSRQKGSKTWPRTTDSRAVEIEQKSFLQAFETTTIRV